MKYIPLDEIENLLKKYSYSVVCDLWLKKDIQSLKTIDLSIIDEMIEENIEYPENDHNLWYRSSLKELKERLSLNK